MTTDANRDKINWSAVSANVANAMIGDQPAVKSSGNHDALKAFIIETIRDAKKRNVQGL